MGSVQSIGLVCEISRKQGEYHDEKNNSVCCDRQHGGRDGECRHKLERNRRISQLGGQTLDQSSALSRYKNTVQ